MPDPTLTLLLVALQHPTHGDCSAVLVRTHGGYAVAYRRDATYRATLHLEVTTWAGRGALREYKLRNGRFCHTVITEDGWVITIGGADDESVNRGLEELGERVVLAGEVTEWDLERALDLLRRIGIGHFLVGSPDGTVGVAVYRYGRTLLEVLRLAEGEYVLVPNDPRYYDRGRFEDYDTDPVRAAAEIAGLDPYGVNRRDVLVYLVEPRDGRATVRVWVAYDGGALLGRRGAGPDPVEFMGCYVPAEWIPRLPDLFELGTVTLGRPMPTRAPEGNSRSAGSPVWWPVPVPAGRPGGSRWRRATDDLHARDPTTEGVRRVGTAVDP
ncbi:hypothetical protein [Methanopyrus kandleri]|uniref:Uncharacterized protein conserved in archaea n=1 Tax=Methanopyrus kandleri (strain AV19 / DSM 6324 / JCM 9639 / NBRC 100938) TaxID=190192 RepID=Q8TVV6_METKA|nr:hypothetical protein [Methanopyrus kandleri]AAM02495.1 Uncharacterized protein conserved in archaea [Methanopyrus kandleri AV19]